MSVRINLRCYFDDENLARKLVCNEVWEILKDLFELTNGK